jgi:hypothetical protein
MTTKKEAVYDKYGFYIGDRITTVTMRKVTRTRKPARRRYTQADFDAGREALAAALETAIKTGGDVRVSRSGIDVTAREPGRSIFD